MGRSLGFSLRFSVFKHPESNKKTHTSFQLLFSLERSQKQVLGEDAPQQKLYYLLVTFLHLLPLLGWKQFFSDSRLFLWRRVRGVCVCVCVCVRVRFVHFAFCGGVCMFLGLGGSGCLTFVFKKS